MLFFGRRFEISSSESDSGNICTSEDSEFSFNPDVRVEFEEPNAMLEEQSTQEENREVGAPYGDEPLASDEWIGNYQKEKEQEEINRKDLQNRLEKVIPTNGW